MARRTLGSSKGSTVVFITSPIRVPLGMKWTLRSSDEATRAFTSSLLNWVAAQDDTSN